MSRPVTGPFSSDGDRSSMDISRTAKGQLASAGTSPQSSLLLQTATLGGPGTGSESRSHSGSSGGFSAVETQLLADGLAGVASHLAAVTGTGIHGDPLPVLSGPGTPLAAPTLHTTLLSSPSQTATTSASGSAGELSAQGSSENGSCRYCPAPPSPHTPAILLLLAFNPVHVLNVMSMLDVVDEVDFILD